MHGLPASILGCNMKDGSRKPRSGLIKKHAITQTPLLGMPYNICVTQFSCKVHGFPGELFRPQEDSLRLNLKKIYTKTIPAS